MNGGERNPASRDGGGAPDFTRGLTKSFMRNWLAWLLVGGLVVLFALRPSASARTIGYSELKQKIGAGEVTEAFLSQGRVTVVTRGPAGQAGQPGERLTAVRVDDPTLVPLLERQHVAFAGTSDGDWFTNLL